MAFKLDKQDRERRAGLIEDLRTAATTLEDAVTAYNTALAELREPVETALATYNIVLTEVRGFAEDIANEKRGNYDDKSDKWQESDKGQAADQWISAWEELGNWEDVELSFPEDLEIDPALDHAGDMENNTEEEVSE